MMARRSRAETADKLRGREKPQNIDNVLAPCYYGSTSITQRGNNRRVKDDDQNNPGVGEGSAWIFRPERTDRRRSVLGREGRRPAVGAGAVLQSTRQRRNFAGRLEVSVHCRVT